MAHFKQLIPEPPHLIPLVFRQQGLKGIGQWFESKVTECALKGEVVQLWEVPPIKKWLHHCVDTQPSIIKLVTNLGWKFDTVYYFFKLRRNFDMVPSGLGFRLKRRPGFGQKRLSVRDSQLSTSENLKGLLQKLHGLNPWHTLLSDFLLTDKLYLIEAPENIAVNSRWDVTCRIEAGTFCVARDSSRDDYGVIITPSGSSIPAYRKGHIFETAGHVVFNEGRNADWRIVT